MITAGKLIELLSEYDQDTPIILARDPEGNGFHPLSEPDDVSHSRFCIDGYQVETGPFEITDDMKEEGWGEDDLVDGPPCIVLWPGYPDDALEAVCEKFEGEGDTK